MTLSVSIVFPALAIVLVLAWFIYWARCHSLTIPAGAVKEGFSRRDWLWMLGITALYAVVAFAGLGSTKAPQSFLKFEHDNLYAQIELSEATEISALRYYSGLGTYDYKLEFSADGENWIVQNQDDGSSGMTQKYTQLFRWNDAVLNAGNGAVRYIRIISGGEQALGEVAIYDANGELISAESMTAAAGCDTLLDEQDIIPAEYSYKNGTYFDEIYHARTAYEHIEGTWPYEITHPPLGKLILGLGIRIFGMTPFGWRFSGTLMGVLMLPALYIFLKKLFDATAIAVCGTTIFAFDFMHYTQTRLATIDSYVTLFILLMYLFMWLWLTEERPKRKLIWLGLCGICFGLGAASKWTGFYAGAGLAVIWLYTWIRRLIKKETGVCRALADNILFCLLFFVLIPALIYYCSYYAYGISRGLSGIGMFFSKDYLQIVLDNQEYMWSYHSDLVATHPYASRWYEWLLDTRPILYYLQYFDDGSRSAFGAFNNPLLSWGGLLAMVVMGMEAFCEKNRRALFILAAYLINLLPWVGVSRLTFAYHYFPCTIFLTLALCSLFNDIRLSGQRWKTAVYGYAGACVGLFAVFYPVLSGVRVAGSYCDIFLKWFSSWPF